jgi:SAM-dependent methyltransferase
MSRAEALRTAAGRKFARLVTDAVVRMPRLWPVFRRLFRLQFHTLAPRWETFLQPDHLAPLEAALDGVDPPTRALDIGTGTGAAALALARRFPAAEVVGVDLAEGMIEQARRKTPEELADRVRFEVSDASQLPFEDRSFDLASLVNMIPFFDELARVVKPGGAAVIAFSSGSATPIYVPPERLRAELSQRGFTQFAAFATARGTALVARKAKPA